MDDDYPNTVVKKKKPSVGIWAKTKSNQSKIQIFHITYITYSIATIKLRKEKYFSRN